MPAVTSLFSFPILLIWAPSLFPLTSLKVAEIWSLVYLFKGPVGFLDLFCCLLISLSFISALIFVTSFLLLTLDFVCSLSSSSRCQVVLLIWYFVLFPEGGLYHCKLPSQNCFGCHAGCGSLCFGLHLPPGVLGFFTYRFFPFITLNVSHHSHLSCKVSPEKSADSLMGVPLYVMWLFLCYF